MPTVPLLSVLAPVASTLAPWKNSGGGAAVSSQHVATCVVRVSGSEEGTCLPIIKAGLTFRKHTQTDPVVGQKVHLVADCG